MKTMLQCPFGHQWEAGCGTRPDAGGEEYCPTCQAPGSAVPEDDLARRATEAKAEVLASFRAQHPGLQDPRILIYNGIPHLLAEDGDRRRRWLISNRGPTAAPWIFSGLPDDVPGRAYGEDLEPDGTSKQPGRAPRFRPDQEFELLAALGMCGTWVAIEGPEGWRTSEREWDESLTDIMSGIAAKISLWREAKGEAPDFPEVPTTPGLYRLRFAFRFEAGYFEGYPALGECDWFFEPLAIEPVVPLPAVALAVHEALRPLAELMADSGELAGRELPSMGQICRAAAAELIEARRGTRHHWPQVAKIESGAAAEELRAVLADLEREAAP